MRKGFFYAALVVTFAAVTPGCTNDTAAGDCTSVCQEAQTRSCTTITNCAQCCTNSDNIAVTAGCTSQRDAFRACGTSVDACSVDSSCSSQENALGACVAAFCIANPTSSACTPPGGC